MKHRDCTINVSGVCFQLLPLPLKFSALFQLPLLLISHSSFSIVLFTLSFGVSTVSLFLHCTVILLHSVFDPLQIPQLYLHCHLCLLCTSPLLFFFKFNIHLCQNILKIILKHLFIKVCRFYFYSLAVFHVPASLF